MDEAFKVILNQGLCGAVAVIEAFVVFFLYKENKESNARRLDDMRTSRDAILDPLRKLQEASDALIKKADIQNEILSGYLIKKSL